MVAEEKRYQARENEKSHKNSTERKYERKFDKPSHTSQNATDWNQFTNSIYQVYIQVNIKENWHEYGKYSFSEISPTTTREPDALISRVLLL